ncbi:MAG: TIR domain-containing protein [Microcystis wesenbergii Mw_MB_S_20031200_S109]|uniref:TIR domain-containing protein n=1 Tax=Microcystis wesenbergii Mw_MB_S_20031200_S109D TaxID=2486241 RepID=A0A552M3W7_9CHRO|nr:MAG: TIR domain-containing protein [Microcystis wesenbergii Mw_MB_S_20031200_S109]TRV27152.1 MAG: TIR domain-containing protein [Microcystis wesenbergii Mw_MB_S_20031200_S109D]
MIDWTPYLTSVSEKYAQWWEVYTLTDVEGRKQQPKTAPLLGDFWVEEIKRERDNQQEREEKRERFTVLDGLRKYAANHVHVLLKGRPGSGKSTALARLLLEEAQSLRLNQQNQAKIIQIPILIELRLYETSILDLILQFLKRHKLIIDSNTLESWLLENQNFRPLLLFDGINELPSDTARRGDLKNFRQQYAEISMIFTTRDLGIDDLNIEKKLEMLPLTEPQMRYFVKTYLPEKGEEMLKQLGNRLKELGETPLLLWMLCSVFDNNQNKIPANLGLVFQIFTGIYDKKLKADVPTYQESRDWWRELLQVLAWKMTQGESKTEIQVAISRTEAEEELSKFIKNKGLPKHYSKQWLEDLLKYHLIHLEGNDKIAFRHQLIQEYYTAEELKKKLPHLRDEQLQWDYLNYLKWTEPVALLLGMLDKKTDALRVVNLALVVDKKLGARLAGEVKKDWQQETVALVLGLNLPQLFTIELLKMTRSDAAIFRLIQFLKNSNSDVRRNAAKALFKIGGSKIIIPELIKASEHSYIPELIKALEHSYKKYFCSQASLVNIKLKAAISSLIEALEDPYKYARNQSAEALFKIGSETAIPGLFKALEDSHWEVREKAVEALGNIGTEAAMTELIKCLKNPDFVRLNNGDTLSEAREALDTIQNKLKYYHPLSQPMNQQVYISYNWQEDSNEMANQLVQAFAAKGIEIIRDKTHTTYKDSIKNFMQQIGQGKCVVAVISDRYLKSENCMFELVEIARNGDFYQRIFPIILPDARIHKDFERIDYLKYWEDEKAKLQAKYKQIDLAKTNSILATLNLYDEIRGNIDNLTNILKDMNTLNIDLHRQSEFAAMIETVETKLVEDRTE